MIPDIPFLINYAFIAISVVTIVYFHWATGKNKSLLLVILMIAAIQAVLGYNHFFLKTDTIPPRFLFLMLPSMLLILSAFFTAKGRRFIDSINLEKYTYLHTIRIFVEIVLLQLFLHQLLPQSMTFEGRNFDILAGITAPFVAYFGLRQKKMSNKAILLWNIVCLALVLQVVVSGILSAPSVFQQLAFDQSNVAISYFPFVWLPSLVVPAVVFGHLVAIRRSWLG